MISDKFIWLSLGENCLVRDIFETYKLNFLNTIYASARSNIDYALQLEKTNYKDLIETKYLKHFKNSVNQNIVINQKFKCSNDIFHELNANGFEFSHHDVIGNKKHRGMYIRRINRQLDLRGKRNVIFTYHHRMNDNMNVNYVRDKLKEFQQYYTNEHVKCVIVFLYQNLVNTKEERKLDINYTSKNIIECVFHTQIIWEHFLWGEIPNRNIKEIDDDLFKQMIDSVNDTLNKI